MTIALTTDPMGANLRAATIPARTAAATKARKVRAVQRLALRLGAGLALLPDEWLGALARVILNEVSMREQLAALHVDTTTGRAHDQAAVGQ